jgi:hypothetical protein
MKLLVIFCSLFLVIGLYAKTPCDGVVQIDSTTMSHTFMDKLESHDSVHVECPFIVFNNDSLCSCTEYRQEKRKILVFISQDETFLFVDSIDYQTRLLYDLIKVKGAKGSLERLKAWDGLVFLRAADSIQAWKVLDVARQIQRQPGFSGLIFLNSHGIPTRLRGMVTDMRNSHVDSLMDSVLTDFFRNRRDTLSH